MKILFCFVFLCSQLSGNRSVKCVPKRYIVTFLTFLGNVILYLLRTNLSIAIIEMTSDKLIKMGNESYVQVNDYPILFPRTIP